MAKRKRGGLAGIWDRNKHVIKPVAQVAAGIVNPGLAALLGAGMEGFDRPGKGGVGFDVGKGAMGGLKGYGLGKFGEWGAGKLGAGGASVTQPAAEDQLKKSVWDKLKAAPGKAFDFAKANPNAVGMGAQAGASIMEGGATRDVANQRLSWEKEMYEREQEERRKRAAIAQQLYNMVMGQMSYNKGGQSGVQ